jgi:hypothetical protein
MKILLYFLHTCCYAEYISTYIYVHDTLYTFKITTIELSAKKLCIIFWKIYNYNQWRRIINRLQAHSFLHWYFYTFQFKVFFPDNVDISSVDTSKQRRFVIICNWKNINVRKIKYY